MIEKSTSDINIKKTKIIEEFFLATGTACFSHMYICADIDTIVFIGFIGKKFVQNHSHTNSHS